MKVLQASNAAKTSLDALATRAKIGVIVPATNTVVQPEMEAMRPAGVTNHVSRMLLPPRPYDDMQQYRQALETERGGLEEALELLLKCEPHAVAHGHSIHSFRGDRARAEAEQARLEAMSSGVPFVTPSVAVLAGLEAIGNPNRLGVLTPYWPPADALIAEFFTACGFHVVATHGLQAKGPISVAQFTPDQIMAGFDVLAANADVEALVHVGTNLPVSALTDQIEERLGRPLIGVNVATYWWALRRAGINDRLNGFGLLAREH
jgi:maleate isomerase